ncbi:ABC transporter ATP-binding protein [Aliidongia dinghuensis]|uniref:ABC transporter ATP-binding protein n=1 Tax=Aliidongia dinghuensis TaxID=1867774 RepID=A0A8J2YPT6_9PROT|nr:ABC transporter ATP-binding protein [Aliidongia dinghuensis]GGF01499.1 ABC transporter ATP-binding protein [Aliidongia dinghuensis]
MLSAAVSPSAPQASSLAVPALSVEDVSHAFGARQALDKVAFALAPGDFTVLLGLNGAGKTTLFSLATGLYHCRRGRIAVFGHDIVTDPSPALASIGVVFQQPTLDLDLTIEQNLYYHASLHGMARSAAAPRIAAELERVGLAARRRDRIRQLSGGQRRRVELARALVHGPALLLLDEPTVGLDMESRAFLLDHVRRLCAERRLAVLWATHLIDEAGPDARAIVLHGGRVLADGAVPQILRDAGTTTLKAAFERLVAGASSMGKPS